MHKVTTSETLFASRMPPPLAVSATRDHSLTAQSGRLLQELVHRARNRVGKGPGPRASRAMANRSPRTANRRPARRAAPPPPPPPRELGAFAAWALGFAFAAVAGAAALGWSTGCNSLPPAATAPELPPPPHPLPAPPPARAPAHELASADAGATPADPAKPYTG